MVDGEDVHHGVMPVVGLTTPEIEVTIAAFQGLFVACFGYRLVHCFDGQHFSPLVPQVLAEPVGVSVGNQSALVLSTTLIPLKIVNIKNRGVALKQPHAVNS